ncbi:MAG: L,D-transpeptidase [Nitrososphaerota archaeon]
MRLSTQSTMSATPVTTIDDWRPFLEERVVSRQQLIEIPLELRLILITTAIVLALVATGAQLTNVVRGQFALASQQTQMAALLDTWQPDGICHAASTAPRMISAQELASSHTSGVRETRPGVFAPCQMIGLVVPEPLTGVPATGGKVILVSLSQQWLWAYQDGKLVFANPVATGMRNLRTPRGTFYITYTLRDTTIYSPWPRSSPYYYPPEHINYALHFRAGGFYIHDAPWRQMFGPGAQDPHTTPDGSGESGSHGGVNMTTSAAAWLYDWAPVGTNVEVVA